MNKRANERRIWFVTENYWPEENTTAFLISKMVDSVARRCPVGVITFGVPQEERHPNITTVRVKNVDFLDKRKLIQRFLKQFLQSFRLCWRILKHVRYNDKVVVVTSPAFILLFTALVKNWKNFHLTILVHDVFPDNLVVIGAAKSHQLFYRFLHRLFTLAYRQADSLITIGRDMQKQVQRKVKKNEKVLFIPNFAETDSLKSLPKEENKILQKLGLTDKFVLLFTGNMGRMQNIDFLLNVAHLLEKDRDIHFLFIGHGAFVERIEKQIQEKQLQNITLLPPMHRSQAVEFLNAGDVGIVSLLPNSQGCGVPSKTYTYLAVAKPILAIMDRDAEVSLLVQEADCGWYGSPSDSDSLVKIIRYLKENPTEVNRKANNAQTVSKEVYAEKFITSQLSEIFCKDLF